MKLSIRQQVNRIQKVLDQATFDEVIEGKDWYADARKFAYHVAKSRGLSVFQVAQLISLLSPQKKWGQNKADVLLLLDNETDSIFSTKRTLSECVAVVDGEFEIPATRLKTYAFAKCIEGSEEHVVIDRHAIKIAAGQYHAKPIIITDKRYRDASEAYKIVAEANGLKPHAVQAITWVTYKRIVNR